MTTGGEQAKRPFGVFSALSAGLEMVTGHLWLLVVPVALDALLWIGPRLSGRALFEQSLATLSDILRLNDAMQQLFLEAAARSNLLTSLSLPLIGVPALMSGPTPERAPLASAVVQIDTNLEWLALYLALTFAGSILSAMYLTSVGRVVRSRMMEEISDGWLGATAVVWLRLVVLGLVFLALLLIVMVPLLPLLFLAGLLSNFLAFSLLVAGALSVVISLCLALPGVVVNRRPALTAVIESVRLARYDLAGVARVVALLLIASAGTKALWQQVDDGSWLTAVSIVGHAFISTSLFAALFIYYRERYNQQLAQQSLAPLPVKPADPLL